MALRKKIDFEIQVYNSINELDKENIDLMNMAIQARKKAYAPYSKFNVGAAVLLENGEIVLGNNQENACYPTGLCAERVAVFYAGANFPGIKLKAIAVSAASLNIKTNIPAAPCGGCRQAILEYEFKQDIPIKILMMGETGNVIECESISHLLPLNFNNSFLK